MSNVFYRSVTPVNSNGEGEKLRRTSFFPLPHEYFLHKSGFVHGPHYKITLYHILAWWKARYIQIFFSSSDRPHVIHAG